MWFSRSAAIAPDRPPANPAVARALAHYSSAIAYADPREVEVLSLFKPWVLPAKAAYVGFVADPPAPLGEMTPGLVAVACGGGTFAADVCRLVLAARERLADPKSVRLRFLTGPMADSDAVAAVLDGQRGVELLRTGHTQDIIRDAAAVISCAGYNNAALLARTDLPVVFLPVADDQRERIGRLAGLPGIWALDPHADDAVEMAADALGKALACGRLPRGLDWDFNGADAAARWVLDEACASAWGGGAALRAGGGR